MAKHPDAQPPLDLYIARLEQYLRGTASRVLGTEEGYEIQLLLQSRPRGKVDRELFPIREVKYLADGKLLRARRLAAFISERELSRRAGLSARAIYQAEHGLQRLTHEQAARVSEVLG